MVASASFSLLNVLVVSVCGEIQPTLTDAGAEKLPVMALSLCSSLLKRIVHSLALGSLKR